MFNNMFQRDTRLDSWILGFTTHVMAERFIPDYLISRPLDKSSEGSGNEIGDVAV